MEKRIERILILVVAGFLFFSSPIMAQSDPSADTAQPQATYGSIVGKKLGTGVANLATGWIEIPKNTVNLVNDVDTKWVLFGVVGGIIKGTLHTLGRTMTGVLDFITFPLPTEPMIHPPLVWEKFGEDTTYGPYFELAGSDGE